MKKVMIMGLCLLALTLLAPTVFAGSSDGSKDWEFNLTPMYLWMINMNGEMTLGTTTTPVVTDFSQIVENLEFVFTGHFEGVHKSGFGFLTDLSYSRIGGQQTIPVPVTITLDVDFTNILVEFAGIYRIHLGENAFDFIAGTRYSSLEPEIGITTSLPLPSAITKKVDWWDAMIGGRFIWSISEKWNLLARADFGFLGSNLTWNLSGLVEYKPWKHVSLVGGYRYMDIDYDQGTGADRFKYDMSMYGPILGVNITW